MALTVAEAHLLEAWSELHTAREMEKVEGERKQCERQQHVRQQFQLSPTNCECPCDSYQCNRGRRHENVVANLPCRWKSRYLLRPNAIYPAQAYRQDNGPDNRGHQRKSMCAFHPETYSDGRTCQESQVTAYGRELSW